ncbi:MAG: signal recognition particle-docking protein FtsY [Desulfovibrio sp.]|nr:signal recognition particle-docking protein FtsY [Desulfovibrio sp.]
MGFFSRLKKLFGSQAEEETKQRESLLDSAPATESETSEKTEKQPVDAILQSVPEDGRSTEQTEEIPEERSEPVSELGKPAFPVSEEIREEEKLEFATQRSDFHQETFEETHVISVTAQEAAQMYVSEDEQAGESEFVVSQEVNPLAQKTLQTEQSFAQEDDLCQEAETPKEKNLPEARSEAQECEKVSVEPLPEVQEAQKTVNAELEFEQEVPERGDAQAKTASQSSQNLTSAEAETTPQPVEETSQARARSPEEEKLVVRLREAEPKLSVWLGIVLEGVEEAGDLLNDRLRFLLRSLEAPEEEIEHFVGDFAAWLEEMEYTYLEEFRSELQYRLALALELEDEEDERNRLLVKIHEGLSKTREQLQRKLNSLLASHGSLDDAFYEHLEEIFITADLGYEASLELVERLRRRAQRQGVKDVEQIGLLLREELEEIFHIPAHITAYTAPEVVLMVGVNGVGKTTTIGKLAHRERLRGRKVMICAADTFRAAAIEQLKVWAERAGALFHAKQQGSDPASVAYEALDLAMQQGVDLLFIDTAGRLQTKTNLMEELSKIRNVIGKKHPGSPHRTVLVIDATTGQNALSQVKLFKEASGVDELILTKLDGTAKGGFAIALALQYKLPFSFIGLGEKLEDLRPFSGKDFADALVGGVGKTTESA